MPEGPEIRLAADRVADAIVGRRATTVSFAFDRLKPYEALLSGQTVTGVESRGKAMLTHFDNDLTIYSHNQLYGVWMIRRAHDLPDTKRQLRLAIHNDTHSALLYSASEIDVWPYPELDSHPFLSKLGPDPLNDAVTAEDIERQLAAPAFRRRRLYALLLDQGFVAGLGNYLRSEILFVAGVHFNQRPVDLSAEKTTAVAQAALDLTRQSYATKGITNDLALYEKLRAKGLTRRQSRWWVFGREDAPCFQCGTPICKQTVGGRRLYFCPTCQAE
jgi:endonuclease-8